MLRATDDVGNTSAVASYQFEIEQRAPGITITAGPTGTVTSNNVAFSYSSDRPGVRFECSLDNASFESCPAQGKTYSGLSDGAHSFRVRAIDDLGNTSQPAGRSFTINTKPAPTPAPPPPPAPPKGKPEPPKPPPAPRQTTICVNKVAAPRNGKTVVKVRRQPAKRSFQTRASWILRGGQVYRLQLKGQVWMIDRGQRRGVRRITRHRRFRANRFQMNLRPGFYTVQIRAYRNGKWEKRGHLHRFAVCARTTT